MVNPRECARFQYTTPGTPTTYSLAFRESKGGLEGQLGLGGLISKMEWEALSPICDVPGLGEESTMGAADAPAGPSRDGPSLASGAPSPSNAVPAVAEDSAGVPHVGKEVLSISSPDKEGGATVIEKQGTSDTGSQPTRGKAKKAQFDISDSIEVWSLYFEQRRQNKENHELAEFLNGIGTPQDEKAAILKLEKEL